VDVMSAQFADLVRDVAILFPAFLFVFTFRGFFKAWVAKIMGDKTAYVTGFLTLNPVAHVDVFGLLIILLGLFLIGGMLPGLLPRALLFLMLIALGVRWTFPIPINERNFSNRRRGMIVTTLAGPAGNFFLALIFLYLRIYLPFHLLSFNVAIPLAQVCSAVTEMAIYFGVIDLIPIPPFDGGYLLAYLAPPSFQDTVRILEQYSLFILLSLFLLPGVSDLFFGFLSGAVYGIRRLLLVLVI